MNHRRPLSMLIFTLAALLSAAAPARAVGNEYQTLELVRTYTSEAEVQAAYPEAFSQPAITDDNNTINFYDPQTGKLLKQLPKASPNLLRNETRNQHAYEIKKTYSYQIAANHSLLMQTAYEGEYLKGTDMSEAGPQPQRRILYNRAGEVITELPPLLNIVQDSPDHNYFVAAHSGEVGADFLYFYDIQGNLLKQQEMNKYIEFKYSSDGEYVKVRTSSTDKHVYLFSKTGDLLAQFDYRTLFRENLFDFHVSDDAQLLLFSMFNNAYLVSNDGKIIWKKPYLRIIDCRFDIQKNYLILYSPIDKNNLKESRKSIQTVSLSNGELLDTIEDVELVQFTQQGVVVRKEGQYYDYTIR